MYHKSITRHYIFQYNKTLCNRFNLFRYVEAWDQGDEGTGRATNQRDDQYGRIRRIRIRCISCALLAK